jgi:molecular chaperone GrpE
MAEDHPTDTEAPPRPLPPPDDVRAEPRPSAESAPAAAAEPLPEGEAAQAFHQRARLAEDRLAEVLAAYRQIKSENEGFRERISKNLQRRFTQRHETLLLKFIDILDNLDRALEAAQISYAGQPLLEGMILVRTQLLQRLQEEGLERIPVLGLPFDPAVSESVATQPVADPDHHHLVVKELMRGYRVNGRIVRPSRVVIGMFSEGAAAPEPKGAAEHVVDNAPAPAGGPAHEPSIEEIVARAEAQEALFPGPVESEADEDEDDGGSDPSPA